MKNLLSAALLLVFGFTFHVSSSQTEIRRFESISRTPAHLYTFNAGEEFYTSDLKVFDLQLNELKSHVLDYKKVPSITATSGNEMYSFMYITYGKNGDLYRIDKTGDLKVVKELEDDKSFSYGGWVEPFGESGCILVRSQKPKKLGFEVTCFDNNLVQTWTKIDSPEKGSFDLLDVASNNEKIFILYSVSSSGMSSTYEIFCRVMSTSGDILSDTKVGGDNAETVQELELLSDGTAVVLGYYGESRVDNYLTMPLGMYCSKIDASGNWSELGKIDFKEQMGSFMHNPSYGGRSDIPAIIPELVVMENGKIKVFGESCFFQLILTAMPGGAGQSATGSDIWLMDAISWEPESGAISVSAKPHKHVSFQSQLVPKFKYTIGDMKDANALSLIAYNDGELLVYGWHRQFKYVSTITVNENYENISSRIFFGKPIYRTVISDPPQPKVLAGSLAPFHASKMAVKREMGKPYWPLTYSGAFHISGSTLLVYEYNSVTRQLVPTIINL